MLRAAALALLLVGCTGGQVVRVFDGVPRAGRFISDFAYAAFARGAELEARGEYDAALIAYAETVRRDPEAVLAWVRRGAVACALKDRAGASRAFAEAERLDTDFEPLWRERAECATTPEEALAFSARAVAADPMRLETVLFHVELLAEVGRREEAERWLRSVTVRSPHRRDAWALVARLAASWDDDAWRRQAERQLRRLDDRGDPRARFRVPGWTEVDRALVDRDLERARQSARKGRLDVRLLPARAILAGRPALAREEASLRVAADPSDADARVALALATDLEGSAAPLRGWSRPSPTPLLEATRWLMAEWLLRHHGPDEAEQWLGEPVGDPRHGLRRAFGQEAPR